MHHFERRTVTRLAAAVLIMGALFACGCGRGPKTYPVNGKVEVESGDVASLAGSTIEAALDSDSTVRASGEIRPDGSFTLETQRSGSIRIGAQKGSYQVRIILNDDTPQLRKQAAKTINPRFLQFETSGLTFAVPNKGDVSLKVSPH